MNKNTGFFWLFTALAWLVALTPYFWHLQFQYKLFDVNVVLVSVVLWIGCLMLALRTIDWKWRDSLVILLSAPISLFPVVVVVCVFSIWKVRGFAP